MQVTNESIEGMIQQIEDYVSNFTPLKGDLEMIECLRELLDRRRREEWISVDEKLPAPYKAVLWAVVHDTGADFEVNQVDEHGHWIVGSPANPCYWRELPSAPTKEGAE
jgi:hypothetical protein